jgi:hypothetical protein
MVEFFLFVLGVIGMTHILVDASIFESLRKFIDAKLPEKVAKVIHCYQCTGFWSGVFCGWLAFPDGGGITWGQLFLAGCAGSILANFMALYMNYLEAKTVITLPADKEE